MASGEEREREVLALMSKTQLMEFVGNRCYGTYLSMHRKRRKRSRGTKLHEVSARFPVNSACACRLLFIDYWYITTLNAVSYFPAFRVREAAHIIKVAEQAIITSSSSSAILRWAWFEICAIFFVQAFDKSWTRSPTFSAHRLSETRSQARFPTIFSSETSSQTCGPQTSSPAKISSEHTGLRQIASR